MQKLSSIQNLYSNASFLKESFLFAKVAENVFLFAKAACERSGETEELKQCIEGKLREIETFVREKIANVLLKELGLFETDFKNHLSEKSEKDFLDEAILQKINSIRFMFGEEIGEKEISDFTRKFDFTTSVPESRSSSVTQLRNFFITTLRDIFENKECNNGFIHQLNNNLSPIFTKSGKLFNLKPIKTLGNLTAVIENASELILSGKIKIENLPPINGDPTDILRYGSLVKVLNLIAKLKKEPQNKEALTSLEKSLIEINCYSDCTEQELKALEDAEELIIQTKSEQMPETGETPEFLRINLQAKLIDLHNFVEREIKLKIEEFIKEIEDITKKADCKKKIVNKAVQKINSEMQRIQGLLAIKIPLSIPPNKENPLERKQFFLENAIDPCVTITHLINNNFSTLFGVLASIAPKGVQELQASYNAGFGLKINQIRKFAAAYSDHEQKLLAGEGKITEGPFVSEIFTGYNSEAEVRKINQLIQFLSKKDETLNAIPTEKLISMMQTLQRELDFERRKKFKDSTQKETQETIEQIEAILEGREIIEAYNSISEINFTAENLLENLNDTQIEAINYLTQDYEKAKANLSEEEKDDLVEKMEALKKAIEGLDEKELKEAKEKEPFLLLLNLNEAA